MCESSVESEIAIGLCLFLDHESPVFYHHNNMHGIEISKLTEHHVTTAQVQSLMKVRSVATDVHDPITPTHSRFSCLLFTVC